MITKEISDGFYEIGDGPVEHSHIPRAGTLITSIFMSIVFYVISAQGEYYLCDKGYLVGICIYKGLQHIAKI